MRRVVLEARQQAARLVEKGWLIIWTLNDAPTTSMRPRAALASRPRITDLKGRQHFDNTPKTRVARSNLRLVCSDSRIGLKIAFNAKKTRPAAAAQHCPVCTPSSNRGFPISLIHCRSLSNTIFRGSGVSVSVHHRPAASWD
ncbi:hypothetical protein Cob_v011025 [Colletotrichum orbiculare MAFF 240422]|uniref:Uncharacterized protein n=1 Tax=Colletotrichum orbiculare (strain 104-T / ATCC 96160 / CBS 514.97 / LARS 414 / MAFF 240422) TaxID=1213857 RepID=A0A484FEZ0_COLOR|nr:hypothetical protein Cob_v011025 [Colletotrichum orbiculare MAFF 240422]